MNTAPGRYVGQGDPFGGVNLQFRRLGPLRTPAPRRIAVRRRRASERPAGSKVFGFNCGTRRTALQPSNLILQPLNLLLLLANDLQQTPHHGRLVALGDLGQFRFEGRDEHGVQYSQFDHGKRRLPAVNEHLDEKYPNLLF
ncbi:MAG: hypothetical protein MZV65_20885 [Chromatiales bacterium]|nr:hypothetical protein [Chromatiales bacterium]